MSGDPLLPYHTAQSSSASGLFNTAMGKLQRQLHKGEYDIFRYAPIFESDFIQITKRGEVIDVHNRVRMVTVGIACTSPLLTLPDVMLLARPAAGCDENSIQAPKGRGRRAAKTLELTRLLPLKFVKVTVHDREKQQLRLKFATGRSCYLQLCPPPDGREDLFAYWEKLVYLLRPPVDGNSSSHAVPAGDAVFMPVFEDRKDWPSLATTDVHGKGDPDQVSIRSLHIFSEVSGVTSAAFAGGEGTPNTSHKPSPKTRPPPPALGPAAGTAASLSSGTVSVAVAKSASLRQTNTAVAAAVTKGPRGSKISLTKVSSESVEVAVAGVASRPVEPPSMLEGPVGPSAEAGTDMATVGEKATGKTVAETAGDPAVGRVVSASASAGAVSEQDGNRQDPPPSTAAQREPRARRERGDKDTVLSRRTSGHRRTGQSHHKTGGNKVSRKSSGRSSASRRATRRDQRDKGHSGPGDSQHSSTHKGVSRTPRARESRTSRKAGRSLSVTSSGSRTKRLTRISSFLRSVRASLSTRTGPSPRARGVDVVSKTVENSNIEAILETAEGCQGLEISGTVTSEIMETVAFETH